MKFEVGDLVECSKKNYMLDDNPLGVIMDTNGTEGTVFVLWTKPPDWTGDRCYWCSPKTLKKVP